MRKAKLEGVLLGIALGTAVLLGFQKDWITGVITLVISLITLGFYMEPRR